MNNHASLYILLTFIAGALLLVLVSYLRSKKENNSGELTPKIPYTWDIPRYNDVEERFIKLKNVWLRLFCLVLIVSGGIKGFELINAQPLKQFPNTDEERFKLYKSEVRKLSLTNLDNLTKKQSILKSWLSEDAICKDVEVKARQHIMENYKKSPKWMVENKFELTKIASDDCVYARGLSRALLTECSDSSCISRIYNQINKYYQTGDSLDRPQLSFSFESYKIKERSDAKDIFSYVGWYLDNKRKQ